MEKQERWLVCAGGAEFLEIAGALVATERVRAIEWEHDALHAYTRVASEASGKATHVAVGDGLVGISPQDAACTLAALVGGPVVLCTARASEVAVSVAARGVAATVEPAGFERVLGSLGHTLGHAVEGESTLPQESTGPCALQAIAAMDLEEPDGLAEGEVMAGSNPSLALRTTGRLPRVETEDEVPAPMSRASELLVAEPVAYRPLITLPQRDDATSGLVAPVPTICFTSARGGVGKTALSAMTALALAREGLVVALIDMDFQFGTCLGYVGADETDGLLDLGEIPKSIQVDGRVLARCRTVPEPNLMAYEFCRSPEQAEVLAGFAGGLLKVAREGADVAIVDVPTGVGEAAAQVLDLADRCLLVTDRRAFSIESITAYQSLCARMGVPRTKLATVVNRCDPRHRDEGFLERLRFSSQGSQIFKVVEGGQEVSQMLAIGSAGELLMARNRFALSASDLARAIAGEIGCRLQEARPSGLAVPGMLGGRGIAASGDRKTPRRRRKEQREEVAECPF